MSTEAQPPPVPEDSSEPQAPSRITDALVPQEQSSRALRASGITDLLPPDGQADGMPSDQSGEDGSADASPSRRAAAPDSARPFAIPLLPGQSDVETRQLSRGEGPSGRGAQPPAGGSSTGSGPAGVCSCAGCRGEGEARAVTPGTELACTCPDCGVGDAYGSDPAPAAFGYDASPCGVPGCTCSTGGPRSNGQTLPLGAPATPNPYCPAGEPGCFCATGQRIETGQRGGRVDSATAPTGSPPPSGDAPPPPPPKPPTPTGDPRSARPARTSRRPDDGPSNGVDADTRLLRRELGAATPRQARGALRDRPTVTPGSGEDPDGSPTPPAGAPPAPGDHPPQRTTPVLLAESGAIPPQPAAPPRPTVRPAPNRSPDPTDHLRGARQSAPRQNTAHRSPAQQSAARENPVRQDSSQRRISDPSSRTATTPDTAGSQPPGAATADKAFGTLAERPALRSAGALPPESSTESTARLRPVRDSPLPSEWATVEPQPAGFAAYPPSPAWPPPESSTDNAPLLRLVRPRRPLRTIGALACVVLGLGLIGGAVTGSWLTEDSSADTAADNGFTEARTLWHSVPVDTLFPRSIHGKGAGPGKADRLWSRLAVAADSNCAATLDPLLVTTLQPVGCVRVLRATYTDATSSYVTTVGLVFTEGDMATMKTLKTRFGNEGLAKRTDLLPRTFAVPGTVASRFGDRQRASWTITIRTDVPVVVYAVSGFADGRKVDDPQPATVAQSARGTTAPAQAGLGHEADGIADGVERALLRALSTTAEPPQ